MSDIVETEASLHAQALVICRAVAPFDMDDRVVGDVVGDLAADAAIRAHRSDFLVDRFEISVLGRRQRTRRTGLHAFAARDARGFAHRIAHVEYDRRTSAAKRVADHVVDLLFAAGADAPRALNAGVQVDRHRRMRIVDPRLRASWKARCDDIELAPPVVELRIGFVDALRHVGREQLDNHFLRVQCTRAVAHDLHSLGRPSAA